MCSGDLTRFNKIERESTLDGRWTMTPFGWYIAVNIHHVSSVDSGPYEMFKFTDTGDLFRWSINTGTFSVVV